jgi:hypothetical protein
MFKSFSGISQNIVVVAMSMDAVGLNNMATDITDSPFYTLEV